MEKDLSLIELYYIYKDLLTKKQRENFESYYISDLSLREIAENEKISFQAIRDSIEKSKKSLIGYERILKVNELKSKLYKLNNDKVNQILGE